MARSRTSGRNFEPALFPGAGRRGVFTAFAFIALAFLANASAAQAPDEQPPQEQPDATAPSPSPTDVLRASVHGFVKNAATGEPLARALVRIEGDAVSGTLTDGEGRFEIPAVPAGPQILQVLKPGYSDQATAGMALSGITVNGATTSEHSVRVAPEMPDLVFTLMPTNAIRGQITLSTGDPAQGIAVLLLRRAIQDGRAVWQPATNVRTNSDGAFRFAGLADGVYALYTEPAMDTELPANFVEAGDDKAVIRAGYPTAFYPDARDLAGAGKIQVSGGQQAQANILLTQEPFHLVRATLSLPAGQHPSTDSSQMNVTVNIFDAQGHQLPYTGQYDQSTRTVQAFLPDGTYSMLATTVGAPQPMIVSGSRVLTISGGRSEEDPAPSSMIGQAEFSVAGRPLTTLQIPLVAQRANLVQISLLHSQTSSQSAGAVKPGPIVIMVSQAGGWITDGMVSSFAEGYATGPIETTATMSPGAYWVHTAIPQKGLCESSFTAGGASLAHEPLLLSLGGASAPLTLTLRDDCATLNLSLPPNVATPDTGEEPFYMVYVIPDFDSTADVTPITLRPSSGGTLTLTGLTPGPYHVYTLAAPAELEYRNPDALAALPSQAVSLTSVAATNLVVEVPQHP